MKIEGAIFDLDGTLLDSMSVWNTAGEKYLKSKGITPPEKLFDTLKEMSLYESAVYFRNEYHISDSTEKITADINAIVADYYISKAPLKDGVSEFLEFLSRKNIPMCIATATDRFQAEAALKRNNIFSYFKRIFTCTEIGSGKDKPHIFNAAQEFLSIDKGSLLIFEDAAFAIATAKSVGFKVCGVFDKYETDQKTVKALSDIYIKAFTEAGDYID